MALNQLIGRKREMSQLFKDDGSVVPVTILEVGPCTVTQVKDTENDGYFAVQIGFGDIKLSSVRKPQKGHYKKAGVEPRRRLREVRLEKAAELKAGDVVKVSDVFKEGEWVDVCGTTKGRGYQGGIKRHGFNSGPRGHGTKNMREPGSVGTNTAIAHVLKGKRMPGHLGVEKVTVRNLLVARVDDTRNLLYVRGAVPGYNGADIVVRKAKAKRFAKADRALRKSSK
ncbi:MAG: 50S ribosomal protein L3 [Planctomycetes bacterium]|nr:50S ribosomal protein L3 [Planctomycetota bacterium]MCW8136490.1 50S ribosomal protein L3 [Planctomycetota bacterium]